MCDARVLCNAWYSRGALAVALRAAEAEVLRGVTGEGGVAAAALEAVDQYFETADDWNWVVARLRGQLGGQGLSPFAEWDFLLVDSDRMPGVVEHWMALPVVEYGAVCSRSWVYD